MEDRLGGLEKLRRSQCDWNRRGKGRGEIGEVSRSQIWKELVAHNKENWFYFT